MRVLSGILRKGLQQGGDSQLMDDHQFMSDRSDIHSRGGADL